MKELLKEVGEILLAGAFVSFGLLNLVSYDVGVFSGSATLFLAGSRVYQYIVTPKIKEEEGEE